MTSVLAPAVKLPRRRANGPRQQTGDPSRRGSLHEGLAREIDGLPGDLAGILIGLGVVGIAIPGPIPPGLSFVVAGVLVLRPGLIARFGGPLARRFPRLFRFLIGFVEDLRSALLRRYPASVAG